MYVFMTGAISTAITGFRDLSGFPEQEQIITRGMIMNKRWKWILPDIKNFS